MGAIDFMWSKIDKAYEIEVRPFQKPKKPSKQEVIEFFSKTKNKRASTLGCSANTRVTYMKCLTHCNVCGAPTRQDLDCFYMPVNAKFLTGIKACIPCKHKRLNTELNQLINDCEFTIDEMLSALSQETVPKSISSIAKRISSISTDKATEDNFHLIFIYILVKNNHVVQHEVPLEKGLGRIDVVVDRVGFELKVTQANNSTDKLLKQIKNIKNQKN